MKPMTAIEQLERLEDQLQAVKWMLPRHAGASGRATADVARSIVAETAGLLRGRLPSGAVYERRFRQEWEKRIRPRSR